MAIFRFFKMVGAAILDFKNFKHLMAGWLTRLEMRRSAKFGRNRSKRSGDMVIFQFFKMAAGDGGRRHLGFLKVQTFNGRTAQEGLNASPCQIWSKLVKTRRRYGHFSIFLKMAAAAILNF